MKPKNNLLYDNKIKHNINNLNKNTLPNININNSSLNYKTSFNYFSSNKFPVSKSLNIPKIYYNQNKDNLKKLSKITNVNVTSKTTIEVINRFQSVSMSTNYKNLNNNSYFKKQKKNLKLKKISFINSKFNRNLSILSIKLILKILSYRNTKELITNYKYKILNKIIEKEFILRSIVINKNLYVDTDLLNLTSNIKHYKNISTYISAEEILNDIEKKKIYKILKENELSKITAIMYPYLYKNKNIIILGRENGSISIYNFYRIIAEYDTYYDKTKKEISDLIYFENLNNNMFASINKGNSLKIWDIFYNYNIDDITNIFNNRQCLKTIWLNYPILTTALCENSCMLGFGLENIGEIQFLDIEKDYKRSTEHNAFIYKRSVIKLIELRLNIIAINSNNMIDNTNNDKLNKNSIILSSSKDNIMTIYNIFTRKILRYYKLKYAINDLIELNEECFCGSDISGNLNVFSTIEANFLVQTFELNSLYNSLSLSIIRYSDNKTQENKTIQPQKSNKFCLYISNCLENQLFIYNNYKSKIKYLNLSHKVKKFITMPEANQFLACSINEDNSLVLYDRIKK